MHPLDIHWVYTFASVALVAGASFTGMIALSFSPHRLSRVIPPLLSLAAGALLGTAFGHLLPESIERLGTGRRLSVLLLAGFVTFFVTEKLLGLWFGRASGDLDHRHEHLPTPETAVAEYAEPKDLKSQKPVIANLLIGAAIHSFIDGMALGTAYSAGTNLGVITTIAVLFHEAPHHIGDVSILIHKGVPVKQAVGLSLLASGRSFAQMLCFVAGCSLMFVSSGT